jgi:hypothetical protein
MSDQIYDFLKIVWPWLQPLVIGGAAGFVGSFLALPTKWGERRLGLHFDQRLERVKSELRSEADEGIERLKSELKRTADQDIERLKAELEHIKDRGKLSNEKEYKALADLWDAFNETYVAVNQAIVSFIQFPDLDQMTIEAVSDFLDQDTSINAKAKKSIIDSRDRKESFSRHVQIYQVNMASEKIFAFRDMLSKNEIFIPSNLSTALFHALDSLTKAWSSRYAEFARPVRGMATADPSSVNFLKDGPIMRDRLMSLVRERILRD